MRSIVIILFGLMVGCSDPKVDVPALTLSEEGQLPVAKVGDAVITKSELDHTLAFYSSNPMADFDQAKKEVLNQMIEDQVMFNKAIENGFHKSPEYLNNHRKLLAYEYKKYLQSKVGQNVKVSEGDAKRHYEDTIENYQTKAMYRLAILKNPDTKLTEKQIKSKAKKLKIHEGFGGLAKSSQHYNTKNKGGLLPWVSETSRLPGIPKKVLTKAEKLELGEVDILSAEGDTYYVRLVAKREAETKPFESLSYQLQSELLANAKKELLATYIEQSKDNMPIEIFEENASRKQKEDADKLAPPGFPVR